MISRTDCENMGIPKKEIPLFRDYVRRHAMTDLSQIAPEAKYAFLVKYADGFREERMAQLERQDSSRARAESEIARKQRTVADSDRRNAEDRDRAQHPDRRAGEYVPDPHDVGAVPEGMVPVDAPDMPPRPRRRRRRGKKGAQA